MHWLIIPENFLLSVNLRQIRHVALDLDGTVYKGGHVFDYSVPFLDRLKRLDISYSFLTNNSSRGRKDYARHLGEMGIGAEPGDVFTSADATIEFIIETLPRCKRIFLLGTDSLSMDFAARGLGAYRRFTPRRTRRGRSGFRHQPLLRTPLPCGLLDPARQTIHCHASRSGLVQQTNPRCS